jgi:GAF domain-containing protein
MPGEEKQDVLRDQEIRKIEQAFLDRKTWCAVVGPPLSGRTTLAKQVFKRFTARFTDTEVVLVFLQNTDTIVRLWEQIRSSLSASDDVAGETRRCEDIDLSHCLFEALVKASRPICLIIDNVDEQPVEVLRLMAEDLRRFANDEQFSSQRCRLQIILFGGLQVHYLATDTSPLATILKTIVLQDLAPDAARQLFQSYMPDSQSLAEETFTALMSLTNGHPYLVRVLGKMTNTQSSAEVQGWQPCPATLHDLAASWDFESDKSCFFRIIDCLQMQADACFLVLRLLEDDKSPSFADNNIHGLMCGAISAVGGDVRFRGLMLENALRRYFTPTRRADFLTMHGDWPWARTIYNSLTTDEIKSHRSRESFPRIQELILRFASGFAPSSLLRRTCEELECAGRAFLGSDSLFVWRHESGDGIPDRVGCTNLASAFSGDLNPHLVRSAIRKAQSFNLSGNRGRFVSLGDKSSSRRWALEVRYDDGVPGARWFEAALNTFKLCGLMALELARSKEARLETENRQREVIHNVALRLLTAGDVQQTLKLIVETVTNDLMYECAQICLVFPDKKELRSVASNGRFEAIEAETTRSLDGTDPLADVVRTKSPRIVSDTTNSAENCEQRSAKKAGILSFVANPLLNRRSEVIGVLQVGSGDKNRFNDVDRMLLQLLADDAAVALSIARENDHLTRAIHASGSAMASIDANGYIEYCNSEYSTFFNKISGDRTDLVCDDNRRETLVQSAFHRPNQTITTLRTFGDRCYIVTASAIKDAFNRFEGGIEILVGTRNPVFGLTESFRDMFLQKTRSELQSSLVNLLVKNFGFSGAIFYALVGNDSLRPACCYGINDTETARLLNEKDALRRNSNDKNGDGFECLRATEGLIIRKAVLSSREGARTHSSIDALATDLIYVDASQLQLEADFEKTSAPEWLDVRVGSKNQPWGKLTIDLRSTSRRFSPEDVEVAKLFARWASDAFVRVAQIERTESQASFAKAARIAVSQQGLDATVWDFLLNITHLGGMEFNRAVVFLRHPESGELEGFLCHGAPNITKWNYEVEQLKEEDDRQQFLADARRRRMEAPSEDDSARLASLKTIRLAECDASSAYAVAIVKGKASLISRATAEPDLVELYSKLGWDAASECLLCPLIYDNECEGIVYADRAFSSRGVHPSDAEGLDIDCSNLAIAVRPLRLAEQLRQRAISVTHASLSPVAAIRGLAEGIRDYQPNHDCETAVDLIIAETQRSADLYRKFFEPGAPACRQTALQRQTQNIAQIICDRTEAYRTLMKADDVTVTLDLDSTIIAEIDKCLLGDVFAELASNAYVNIKLDSTGRRCFIIRMTMLAGNACITFANSGPTIPSELQGRIWERFVSHTRGTGIGLSLVADILRQHESTIGYTITDDMLSEFRIMLPAYSKGVSLENFNC